MLVLDCTFQKGFGFGSDVISGTITCLEETVCRMKLFSMEYNLSLFYSEGFKAAENHGGVSLLTKRNSSPTYIVHCLPPEWTPHRD